MLLEVATISSERTAALSTVRASYLLQPFNGLYKTVCNAEQLYGVAFHHRDVSQDGVWLGIRANFAHRMKLLRANPLLIERGSFKLFRLLNRFVDKMAILRRIDGIGVLCSRPTKPSMDAWNLRKSEGWRRVPAGASKDAKIVEAEVV